MQLLGIDFTSAPRRRKPITVARGVLGASASPIVKVEAIDRLESFDAFDALLRTPGPWIGGFDFPFGLPRELVETLGWPTQWAELMRFLDALHRPRMVEQFKAFCAARPEGRRFAHRACDIPAGSSPSMKWVNPPVAFMLQAGAPRLMNAGLNIPGLHAGDPMRVALEAYPGLLARRVVGHASYKSDLPAKHTPERHARREAIVAALEAGGITMGPLDADAPDVCSGVTPISTAWATTPANPRLALSPTVRDACVDDGSGDSLDAVLCLAQAAWAAQRADQGWGLPGDIDPIEGWIIGA